MRNTEWRYPDFGTVLKGHNFVVSGGAELPNTAIFNDNKFEIDLGDDWIEFRFNALSNWAATSFNGWLFRDAAGALPPITGYTVDSVSAGISGPITVGFNDDECWANMAGVTVAGPGE